MNDFPIKILIINAWGGNRGDEAMLNQLSRLLHQLFPKVKVCAAAFRDEALDIDPDIEVIEGRFGVYAYSDLSELFRWLSRWCLGRYVVSVCVRLMLWFGISKVKFLKDYDLVISAPQGPTISDMYSFKAKTLFPLRKAKQYDVPYMILGVSMGPFASQGEDRQTKAILSNASAIVVREDISLDYVQRKFPELKHIGSAIDFVYGGLPCLGRKPKFSQQQYAEDVKRLQPSSAIGLCISLTPARDPRRWFDQSAYTGKIVRFVNHVMATTGRAIILFPHVAFDFSVLETIASGVAERGRVSILSPQYDSDFQQDLIQRLEFFVSSRYHPTIFAVKAGVPVMCIMNQFKVEGMLRKIGITANSCWQDDSFQTWCNLFEQLWSQRREVRTCVQKGLGMALQHVQLYSDVLTTWAIERGR